MVAVWPKLVILTADMPFAPLALDWVLGLMLVPRGRRGLAVWGVVTELEAERRAGDTDVIDIELVIIL